MNRTAITYETGLLPRHPFFVIYLFDQDFRTVANVRDRPNRLNGSVIAGVTPYRYFVISALCVRYRLSFGYSQKYFVYPIKRR